MIQLSFSFISTPERKKPLQKRSSLLAKGSWSVKKDNNVKKREPRIRIEFDESTLLEKQKQVDITPVDITPSSPELKNLDDDKTDPYYLHLSNFDTCSLSTLGFEGDKTLPMLTGSWDDIEIHVNI